MKNYLNNEELMKDSKSISELINHMQTWMTNIEGSLDSLLYSPLVEFINNFSDYMKSRLTQARSSFTELDNRFDEFATEYFEILLRLGVENEKD